MIRLLFALVAFFLGVSQIQKEKRQMRFPIVKVHATPCDTNVLTGWFRELRRLACYPNEFENRKDGLWGPEKPRSAAQK